MKLTWFGGTTVRIQIGGSILVCDPAALPGIDAAELVSAADRVFALQEAVDPVDLAEWMPARAGSLLEGARAPKLYVTAGAHAVIAADGEAPLVVVVEVPEKAGRWARDAVVVAFGTAQAAEAALGVFEPRLLVLALPPIELERAFQALPPKLEGSSLVALEPGLALEV